MLEQFKTQVLLLHSEQSTLERLRAAFDEQYTVHCANSGSEALTTLGDVQIHVLACAQDLPGMSGLETLREAKKRSPDTVGILLAGNRGEEVEALVGSRDMFQIVRGSLTPDALRGIIDKSAYKLRLAAMAVSANDPYADFDTPTGKHIVMATSKSGSALVSETTGAVPVFNPGKVLPQALPGVRPVDILVVTRDEEFLDTIKQSVAGTHNVLVANTVSQAQEAVSKLAVGVAILDAAVVGRHLEKTASRLRQAARRLVTIVAGRRDDGEMLMDLINRGKVYRFLLKPLSAGRARLAVEASVKYHLEAPDSAFWPVIGPSRSTESTQSRRPRQSSTPIAVTADIEGSDKITDQPTPEGMSDTRRSGSAASAVGPDEEDIGREPDAPAAESSRKGKARRATADLDSLPVTRTGLGLIAVIVIAITTATWWWYRGSAVDPGVAAIEPRTEASARSASPEPRVEVDSRHQAARDALADGRIYAPEGDNAIELFALARDFAADTAVIDAEIEGVISQALVMAENALLDRQTAEAELALTVVASVDPENPRLPFLIRQLNENRLSDRLAEALSAIENAEYDAAANAIEGARGLGFVDAAEIDAVAAELAQALEQADLQALLETARNQVEAGNLVAPPGANAAQSYAQVLEIDPDNSAARQGLVILASKLALDARARIDTGDFDGAEALLIAARDFSPESAELTSANAALAAARERVVRERRAAEEAAAQRAKAERLAAELEAARRAEAERKAAEEAAAKRAAAARLAAEAETQAESAPEVAGNDPLPVANPSPVEKAVTENDAPIATIVDAPGEPAAAGPDAAAADSTITAEQPDALADAAGEADADAIGFVPISSLTRVRYVAPKYPRAAQRRDLTGWVDVMFTVVADGSVEDIEIGDSQPGEIFVDAARKAVEGWEFEPVVEDGQGVAKRSAVRLMFAIE